MANIPAKIDGTARCATESALGAAGAGCGAVSATIAADTTLEMDFRPCENTYLCVK